MAPNLHQDIFPLTRNQQEIYFEQLLHPNTSIFNMGGLVTIDGFLRQDLLIEAIKHIYRIHAEPSAVVFEEDGVPLQRLSVSQDFSPTFLDFSHLQNGEQAARAYVADHFQQPMPFGPELPLTSLKLIRAVDPNLHFLYLKCHHLLWDAWAVSAFFQKVVEQYRRLSSGEPDLTADDFKFEKFVTLDQEYLTSEMFKEDHRYWEERFLDSPQSCYSLKRPFTYENRNEMLAIPREQFNQITRFARAENCTPFYFMLTILLSCLAQIHKAHDLSVALPIMNRRTTSFKKTMGLFISIIPFRMQIDPSWSFRTLLKEVSLQFAKDYRHGRFAAGRLVRNRADGLSGGHLVEVSFSFEKTLYRMSVDEIQFQGSPLDLQQQVRPLQIFLRELGKDEDVAIYFDYNPSFIDQAEMKETARRFGRIIDSALAAPDAPIFEVSHNVVDRDTQAKTPTANFVVSDIISMFERLAGIHSTRQAVSLGGLHLTYRELNARANQLAHHLRSLGVKREDIVGICLDRSLETIIAIVATLKAGATYLPLDPDYPTQRLAYLLADSNPRLLITDSRAARSLPEAAVQRLLLDEAASYLTALPSENPGLTIDPAQAAYLIYTSGSTGQPKGCLVTHANVSRLLLSTEDQFGFNQTDVWTLFHSYAFDFSVWEIWGALLYGGRLVIVDYWTSRAPDSFYALLKQEQVTVLNQTPAAFRQLQQVEAQMAESNDSALALRLVIFGGEALELPSLKPWFERHGDQRPQLVNMYGITETTVHVTQRLLRHMDVTSRASLIGEGLSDLQVYLLDGQGQPAPLGVRGEIYVGGAGVARGYWGRPELTAERFLPDPFSAIAGQRMYRSGDVGRRRADGELEYLGRADQQVKIRGYRIEVGEIEATICQHEGVSAAVVLAVGDNDGEKRLVCYVGGRVGREAIRIDELRRYAQERLPSYMVPAAFVVMDRLPLNENGKVDRKGLLASGWSGETQERPYTAPETERAATLARVWAEVLRVERVGIDDNFFELGGDSILALQVVAKARRNGFEITFKDIYERTTIRALVSNAAPAAAGPTITSASPLTELCEADLAGLPADAQDAFPLCSLQAGMLYHSELSPESAIFHDIFSFRLEIPWNELKLRKALIELTRRHASLRTSFDLGSYSEALQIVHKSATIPCEVSNIQDNAEENQRQEINRWIEREKAHAFSLTQAPLLRLKIHLLAANQIQLTVSFHHAVLDGWSVATLITELLLLYSGTEQSRLPQETNDFRAFVYTERNAIASESFGEFWRNQLHTMPMTRLLGADRSLLTAGQVNRHTAAISKELSDGLSRLAQHCSAPLKTILLAAHLKALTVLSGQANAVTGYVTHSRPESDEVKTLGLFLNTLPFSAPDPDCSWTDFVQQVFLKEKELLSNRIYPLASIKQLNNERIPFDVGFNYVHFHVYTALANIAGLKVLDFQIYEETDFALLAQFTRNPGTAAMDLTLVHDSRDFTETEIARIADLYTEVLTLMTDNPKANTITAFSYDFSGNGKLSGQFLPVTDLTDSDTPFVPPTNETEERLKLLYEEVLNIAPIGIRHNFFEFGGNSILATRLIARIRHVLRTDLPLSKLFENPEIERLAACIPIAGVPETTASPVIPRARRELVKVMVSSAE